MNQARLIKQGTQSEQRPKQAQSAKSLQADIISTAVITVRAWVKDQQTTKRLSPRQQFAALFS